MEALAALKNDGHIIDYVVADLTMNGKEEVSPNTCGEDTCKNVVDEAVEALGGTLTSLVNAAGVLQGGAMGDVDLANYTYNMKLNTQVPFEMMVHAIPHLRKAKTEGMNGQSCYPSIVNVSSVNGKQAFANCVTYCMSKAAVDQMTRCASVDLAADGIRVNAVNPGVIETNLQKVRIG